MMMQPNENYRRLVCLRALRSALRINDAARRKVRYQLRYNAKELFSLQYFVENIVKNGYLKMLIKIFTQHKHE